MYGDISFANLIADANGFRKEDIPPVGLMLQIPNIVNTNIHNWEGQYPIYNPTAIIGSLYPNMPMPQRTVVDTTQQRRSHRKFWHVLVEALVGTAIMAFAPELAGAFSGLFSKLIGEVLGFALAGAASNLVQQELAIGLGDQSKLSLNSIGQSALLSMGTAGIAKGIGIDLMKSPQYRNLLDSAVKNIELTIATQGLSFATGQQRHFDWRVMLASVTNTLANVGIKQMDFGTPVFNDAVATASASVASIGIDKLYGNDMNSEAIAANTLGTFIGNQLAAQAKQYYAEYQTKKAVEAQFHVSQIPEIRQELTESEQQFLQSKMVHPNKLGSSHSSPSPSQRDEHHAQARKEKSASHKPNNSPVHKPPHQPHLMAERARQEELLNRSSQRAKEHSRTPVQQPHGSQHSFWSIRKNATNSHGFSQASPGKGAVWDLLDLNPAVSEALNDTKKVSISSGLGLFRSKIDPRGKYNVNYNVLFEKKKSACSENQIKPKSHYHDTSPGSPIGGDASHELQIQSIDAIITAAKKAHLSLRDTAHVLAIARHESGFNPYAATCETSAIGLGQFTDDTWRLHKLPMSEKWNIETQAYALVAHFKKSQAKIREHHVGEVYVYKFYHDGLWSINLDYKGLSNGKKHVYPQIEPITESIRNIF